MLVRLSQRYPSSSRILVPFLVPSRAAQMVLEQRLHRLARAAVHWQDFSVRLCRLCLLLPLLSRQLLSQSAQLKMPMRKHIGLLLISTARLVLSMISCRQIKPGWKKSPICRGTSALPKFLRKSKPSRTRMKNSRSRLSY